MVCSDRAKVSTYILIGEKLDYFNPKEKERQIRFTKIRDSIFKPLSKFLTKARVQPNHITMLSILCLIIACYLPPEKNLYIGGLLFFYVLLDGIDGPLARFQQKNSEEGSIMDIFADQLGVVLIPASAILHFSADGFWASLFTSFYLSTIILMLYLNTLKINYPPVIRVKYVLYVIYILLASKIINLVILDYFLIVFSIYYILITCILMYKQYYYR